MLRFINVCVCLTETGLPLVQDGHPGGRQFHQLPHLEHGRYAVGIHWSSLEKQIEAQK